MAGLACAHRLHVQGSTVTLFDKGRRPGGRLASRRTDALRFDHGAQFATARTPEFRAMLHSAGQGAAIWGGTAEHPRWVGVPGMSALAQAAVSQGIGTLRESRHAAYLHRAPEGWFVTHRDAKGTPPGLVSAEGGERAGPFDAVVLAVPAPQAAGLLEAIGHPHAAPAADVVMAPCWALMLAFDAAHPGPDTAERSQGALTWIARDSARPGRVPLPECWVAHASPAWSRAHLELAADAVVPLLRHEFSGATGITDAPFYAAAHRWRYARTEAPLGVACLGGPDGLVVCGDWCLGPRVEQAFQSGLAAADMVGQG
jgi:predicted NAD/FAD-dependent oxidoreductase